MPNEKLAVYPRMRFLTVGKVSDLKLLLRASVIEKPIKDLKK